MRITAGSVHTGDTVYEPGFVEVDGDRVVDAGPEALSTTLDLPEAVITPGFVDVHCHGGGGAAFTDADRDPAAVERVLRLHRGHGTTTIVASLVTAPIDRLDSQVSALAGFVESGALAGVHLEGPWLAESHKGAHDAALLVAPRPADVARLLKAGRGTVKMATLAPELEHASGAIAALSEAGVVVAVGHTGCDYAAAEAAVALGATGATHLFNAMPQLHHRSPGPVLALVDSPGVTLELIADGVHLAPELLVHVASGRPGRIALITDAMAAAGSADGTYLLGDLEVEVRDGVARLVQGGSIAGSTLTLDAAVANCVRWGLPLADAVRSATAIPADYLGLDAGRLRPDARANLNVLRRDGSLQRVLFDGSWVETGA